MDNERYTYICSLIIYCSAYQIGGPAIRQRIIEQNLPTLQQLYPEQTWTPGRARRLFEGDGLLSAIAVKRVDIGAEEDQARTAKSELGKMHAANIQALIARIDHIRKKLLDEEVTVAAMLAR
jgi:hypothetical protein